MAAFFWADQVADETGPAQPQATADASEAAADPVITNVSQTVEPPLLPPPPLAAEAAPSSPPPPLPTEEGIVSPPPPLPADEAPPPLPAKTPSPDPLPAQEQPAASKMPASHRKHGSVSRRTSPISRRHTRSAPRRRDGSPRRSRRRGSPTYSPWRSQSPADRRRSSRARSRSRSPRQHRSRRVRSPSRRRHKARITPPASSRRRDGNELTERRKGSSGRGDGRSGSHKGRGRSPKQQTPSETRRSSPSVQRRSDEDSGHSTSFSGPSSPESSPVPLRACGSTTLAMPASAVRPAASTPQTQLPVHDEAPTVEQAKALSPQQTAAEAVLSAKQQARASSFFKALHMPEVPVPTLRLGVQHICNGSGDARELVCGKYITEAEVA